MQANLDVYMLPLVYYVITSCDCLTLLASVDSPCLQLTFGDVECNRGSFGGFESSRIDNCIAASGFGNQVVVDCMVKFMGTYNSAYCADQKGVTISVVALGCAASTSTLASRQVRFTLVA